MEAQSFFVAIGQALFAVFGSCVRWLNEKDKRRRKLAILLSEAASALLAGLLIFCLYQWLGINLYLSFALSGVIGHQGAKGLERLFAFVEKKAGIKEDENG